MQNSTEYKHDSVYAHLKKVLVHTGLRENEADGALSLCMKNIVATAQRAMPDAAPASLTSLTADMSAEMKTSWWLPHGLADGFMVLMLQGVLEEQAFKAGVEWIDVNAPKHAARPALAAMLDNEPLRNGSQANTFSAAPRPI
jgi:ABC-type sugar transport system substrate-binding protein